MAPVEARKDYAFGTIASAGDILALAVRLEQGAVDAYLANAADNVQNHGGMGFTWELGLHHYLRRAKVLECLYGDSTYHRRRLLSSTLTELSLRAATDTLA